MRRAPGGYRASMTLDVTTARRLLDDERERIAAAKSAVEGNLADEHEGAGDELSTYDQHPADTGTEVADEERDLGLRDDLRVRLEENAAAHRRLDEGGYGLCERCGRPIGDDRLRAVPSARYCREHQLEVSRR